MDAGWSWVDAPAPEGSAGAGAPPADAPPSLEDAAQDSAPAPTPPTDATSSTWSWIDADADDPNTAKAIEAQMRAETERKAHEEAKRRQRAARAAEAEAERALRGQLQATILLLAEVDVAHADPAAEQLSLAKRALELGDSVFASQPPAAAERACSGLAARAWALCERAQVRMPELEACAREERRVKPKQVVRAAPRGCLLRHRCCCRRRDRRRLHRRRSR